MVSLWYNNAIKIIQRYNKYILLLYFYCVINFVLLLLYVLLLLLYVLDFDCHDDVIQGVSWSLDGSLLITSCKDRLVRLFDPRSNDNSAVQVFISIYLWYTHPNQIVNRNDPNSAKLRVVSSCCENIAYYNMVRLRILDSKVQDYKA